MLTEWTDKCLSNYRNIDGTPGVSCPVYKSRKKVCCQHCQSCIRKKVGHILCCHSSYNIIQQNSSHCHTDCKVEAVKETFTHGVPISENLCSLNLSCPLCFVYFWCLS